MEDSFKNSVLKIIFQYPASLHADLVHPLQNQRLQQVFWDCHVITLGIGVTNKGVIWNVSLVVSPLLHDTCTMVHPLTHRHWCMFSELDPFLWMEQSASFVLCLDTDCASFSLFLLISQTLVFFRLWIVTRGRKAKKGNQGRKRRRRSLGKRERRARKRRIWHLTGEDRWPESLVVCLLEIKWSILDFEVRLYFGEVSIQV